MLRIHFTADDLMRVRIAPAPAPLLELGLAVAQLRRRTDDPVFTHWRHRVSGALPRPARALFDLVPMNGAGPLFLDPVSDGLPDGLDLVLSTPGDTVKSEVGRVRPDHPDGWLRGLVEGDGDSQSVLLTALKAAHHTILAPDWHRLRASFDADIAWRGRRLSTDGLAPTLASLFPDSRWNATILEIPSEGNLDIHPGGRGIVLSPSPVWTGGPLVGFASDGTDLLVYPAIVPLPLVDDRPDGDALAALLGRTRAAMLRCLAREHTTTELAHALRISPSSASSHAQTLKRAGLVTTRRDGKSVRHRATAMGLDLLRH